METLEFAILSPRRKELMDPSSWWTMLPKYEVCPYCHEPFALVIGCHKLCVCGYMEGCQD